MEVENVTRGLPEGPARRAARIAQVGARYGFGYVFGRRLLLGRRARDVGRVGVRLRLALEELGPTFVELGHALSARGDVLPPDVTAELGRTAVPVPPVPFAEVRALLEVELGNALERLFLKFEEAPARVGVLTQAHRVVLPGERPALVVVVGRPGVRRDLLAMRPVADVIRRRAGRQNGEGLPLDPVVTVSEFAAYVANRRDMYFAAQTARRLREMEDFSLRVPEVYRRYSTGHCATFEAPVEAAPLAAEGHRDASEALVRLAILEGVFFADLAPERFLLGDGEVWLADPTEASALDPERLRGVAEVLAAVRREDVEGVVRTLPLAGCEVPQDARVLQRELRDALGSLGGPLWREHSLAEIRARGLEAARRGGAVLSGDVARLFDSLVKAEALGRIGDPDGHGAPEPATEAAGEAAGEAISRFRDPRYVVARTARRIAQGDAYAEYPRQIHNLLNELKDGEVEVVFRHRGLDDLISKVDIFANRLVFALLIAALIIGSSLLGIFGESEVRLLGVNIFGLVGFVIAALLGLALLVGIVRSGRL
ncbi:MAG: AarF/UbiB family protein [Actinomycetota bacterium]|nr:AarF/UbiB family protein [Actinomycetota bacterium]